LAHELKQFNAGIGIVFLTSYADPRLLAPSSTLPKGSVYLSKAQVRDISHLTKAISRAIQGKGVTPSSQSKFRDLTTIQIETLQLLAQGLSNAEIAKRRYVTEKSVEKLISRIAKMLGFEAMPEHNQRVQLARSFLAETSNKSVD